MNGVDCRNVPHYCYNITEHTTVSIIILQAQRQSMSFAEAQSRQSKLLEEAQKQVCNV